MLLFSLFRSQSQTETILFGVFAVVISVFLVIDLGFFNKKAHKITTKSALYQSIFWVFISTIFGYLVYVYDEGGLDASEKYFKISRMTKMLSTDNAYSVR